MPNRVRLLYVWDMAKPEEMPPGALARAVTRAARTAALSTLGAGGWPYGSLVLLAVDPAGAPLLLLSTLAEHTKNFVADDRVSLLADGTASLAEPLTGPRASILGRLGRSTDPAHRARFLARHPDAAGYAGFGDFAIYAMTVERVHLVAGFGRIHWIDSADFLYAGETGALAAAEAEIVDHMNRDHAEAIDLYARHLLGQDGTGWRMTGCDAEGCDLLRDGRHARLPFDRPVASAEAARQELVALVRRARAAPPSA